MSLTGWIVGIAAALLVLFIILSYNRIIRLENRIDNAWAQIDVQLKKRADLVPNLVDTVKGYAKHEKEIMTEVSEARERMMQAEGTQDRAEAGNELGQALKSIFAVAEDYPDLKASQNFQELQQELSSIENKIAYARQHFNDAVLTFNNSIETFPTNLLANMMGKGERDMLEIETADRELPDVEF